MSVLPSDCDLFEWTCLIDYGSPTTYYSPWHIVNIYSIFVEYIYIFMMYEIISLKIAQEVSHFIMLKNQVRTQESGLL